MSLYEKWQEVLTVENYVAGTALEGVVTTTAALALLTLLLGCAVYACVTRRSAFDPDDQARILEDMLDDHASRGFNGLGGVTDKYRWDQTENEVEMEVFLPREAVAIREIQVTTEARRICVRAGRSVILEGELSAAILPGDTVWFVDSMDGASSLNITLSKKFSTSATGSLRHWPSVIKGDPGR